MAKIRVTKEFNFEMAHALWNYDGACKNIHGHSYKVFVTIIGEPNPTEGDPKYGMVIDFKELKDYIKGSVIDLLDHSLIVHKNTESEGLKAVKKMYEKVYVFDFQPTCENLVLYIVDTVQGLLPDNIKLHSVKMLETATSFAEWYADDNN